MTKVERRKALALFLGGAGCLGGVGFYIQPYQGEQPALPQPCRWSLPPDQPRDPLKDYLDWLEKLDRQLWREPLATPEQGSRRKTPPAY